MRHATDGALVRWLDHECDETERAALAEHMEACGSCRARLSVTRGRSERVRFALRHYDAWHDASRTSGRAWRSRRLRWRVAAAAAAVVIIAFSVRPVRAWVIDRAMVIWSAVTGRDGGVGGAQDAPAAGSEGAVSFVPTSDSFVVLIDYRQTSGRLTVQYTSDAAAVARIGGESRGEGLVVLPSGVRVVNTDDSHADYALRVPATASLVVTVAGEPAIRLAPRPAGQQWEVDLTTGARR